MARSIWCGVRGGSTEIVGTIVARAPYSASRSTMMPAWSLVRGTRTSQPNRDLLSNQDSVSRRTTVGPTTASDGNSTRLSLSRVSTSPRVVM